MFTCQQLTQGTSCNCGSCKCPLTQYFKNINLKCETLLIVNQTCSQSDACDSRLGLSCQSGSCKCSLTQIWKSNSIGQFIGCIKFYNYSNGTCSESNQYQTSLICKNTTSSSCNCPTSVSASNCDCPSRFSGS